MDDDELLGQENDLSVHEQLRQEQKERRERVLHDIEYKRKNWEDLGSGIIWGDGFHASNPSYDELKTGKWDPWRVYTAWGLGIFLLIMLSIMGYPIIEDK